jgi:hypothetical protein
MRRAVRQAVAYSVPTIALGILADDVHLLLRFGVAARPAVAMGVAAICATVLLARFAAGPRRRPEPAALAILVVLYVVTLLNSRLLPTLAPVSAGYQALILVGSALFLVWSPRWQLAWLTTAVGLSVVQLATAPAGAAPASASALMVAALAALVSAVGHPLAYFRVQRMLAQQFQLRHLTGVARARRGGPESGAGADRADRHGDGDRQPSGARRGDPVAGWHPPGGCAARPRPFQDLQRPQRAPGR